MGSESLIFCQPLPIRLTEAVCLLIAHNAQGPQRKLLALSFVVLAIGLSRCLREHRVDDLHDELLPGAWQLVDALDLQLQLAQDQEAQQDRG